MIILKPSKLFMAWVILITLAALGCVFCLKISFWLKGLLFCLTMGYASHLFWQQVLLNGRDVVQKISMRENGQWLMQTKTTLYQSELRADTYKAYWFCILRFNVNRRAHSCVIFRDALPFALYRKLLVALNCYRVTKNPKCATIHVLN